MKDQALEKSHVIIGTAGHIDHGKTALVKALTGRDADTLEEEKRRGITIELRFVFMDTPLPDKQIVFIDVPGHEKLGQNHGRWRQQHRRCCPRYRCR